LNEKGADLDGRVVLDEGDELLNVGVGDSRKRRG